MLTIKTKFSYPFSMSSHRTANILYSCLSGRNERIPIPKALVLISHAYADDSTKAVFLGPSL